MATLAAEEAIKNFANTETLKMLEQRQTMQIEWESKEAIVTNTEFILFLLSVDKKNIKIKFIVKI